MSIYIVIIVVLYSLCFLKIRNKKMIYWSCVTILAFISGVRYKVGTDWGMYVGHYKWIYEGYSSPIFEKGYLLLEQLFCKLGFSTAYVMLFIIAVFTLFAFAYAITKNVKEKYWFFSLALFVVTTTYFSTMNTLRQYLAVGILLFGIESLKKEKYKRYIFYILIASIFHVSALIMLLLVAWLYISKRFPYYAYRILQIVFAISLLGLFFDYRNNVLGLLRNVAPSRMQRYLYTSSVLYQDFYLTRNEAAIYKTIFPSVILVVLFIRKSKLQVSENVKLMYFSGYTFYVVLNNLFYGVNVFIRIMLYFSDYGLFLFPLLVESFQTAKQRVMLKGVILIYYFALTCYAIFYKNGSNVIPYQTLFFK